jgi:hypothetical protein
MKRLLLMSALMSVAVFSHAETAPTRYAPIPASGSAYDSWRADNSRTQELIERLNSLINDAEQARAADPRFLRDLRDVLAGYDWPWTSQLLHDDFSDGDFTRAPGWVVAEGQFQVEQNQGLHSLTSTPPPATSAPQTKKDDDLGSLLLGALLEELDDGKSSGGNNQSQDTTHSPRGAIRIAQPVPNSFAIDALIVSHQQQGRIEIGLYRETSSMSGYRLAYVPGSHPALELLRVSERGTSVIEAKLLKTGLEDGRSHQLQLTRNASGYMTVLLDNVRQFRVRDRAYQDDFSGLVLLNDRGDFTLRSITILAAR